MVTQKELKELLHYDPETGVFTWRITAGRMKAGFIAGSFTNKGYLRIKIKRKQYLSHRLAWLYVYGVWPKKIDHIDHIKTDNRIKSLREATSQENGRNQSLFKTNTSGVCGVFWNKRANKWNSQIKVKDKQIFLGAFIVFNDAVIARKSAELKYDFHENHGK